MNDFSDSMVIGSDLTSVELEQIAAMADEIQKNRISQWQAAKFDGRYFIYDIDGLTKSSLWDG